MDAWIQAGRVHINGTPASLGTPVDPENDRITVDGKAVMASVQKRYYAFYKPRKVVTTMSDPEGRPTVADYVRSIPARVYPVGRLDFDAEGILILTNDGDFAQRLIHPSNDHTRIYWCKTKGEPDRRAVARLLEGVDLADGFAKFEAVRIAERTAQNTWIEVEIKIGRNHIVKRLWDFVEHPVLRLIRTQIAGVRLGDMAPGDLRPLTPKEIASCR